MRVFVAGAAGAIGQWLVPALVAAGHAVVATTRSRAKIEGLRVLGSDAVVLDGLDAVAVGEAVGRAAPDVIVHQMTALAGMGGNLRNFDRHFATTNELRTAGTHHLLARRRPPESPASLRRVSQVGRTPGHAAGSRPSRIRWTGHRRTRNAGRCPRSATSSGR